MSPGTPTTGSSTRPASAPPLPAAANPSPLSNKAKADAIGKALGLEPELPMPAVVQHGFELVGEEPPKGGLVRQVAALYALLFE